MEGKLLEQNVTWKKWRNRHHKFRESIDVPSSYSPWTDLGRKHDGISKGFCPDKSQFHSGIEISLGDFML